LTGSKSHRLIKANFRSWFDVAQIALKVDTSL
jgi:hypothetical protein